ncbi:MAG: excinuclease ABC subunit UvrC [Asgard group archaeon]|nr:excinuclease ABC subunit UvrC [Asgard group archaeon]
MILAIKDNIQLKLKSLPEKPGVYIFRDIKSKVIYIGKAKALNKRIKSYFIKNTIENKSIEIQNEAIDIEFIITNSEMEALILENNLIKIHKPRLNARLKDDKTFPYLKVTTNEEIPRVEIVRKREKDNNIYFGPYTDTKALRIALKKALTVFPIARCKRIIKIGKIDRSCLFYQLDRCLAPCVNKVTLSEYKKEVNQFIKLFEGKQLEIMNELKQEMKIASDNLEYEKAAIIRDKIIALDKVLQNQTIVSKNLNAEYDIIGLSKDNQSSLIQILIMRQGRIIEQKHFAMELPNFLDEIEIVTSFIKQYYSKTNLIPKKIITQFKVDDNAINEWLSSLLGVEYQQIIDLPSNEEEKSLIELANDNAKINKSVITKIQKIKEDKNIEGLQELKETLNLEEMPSRIEAFDISTLQGSNNVASCVVFENGKLNKKDYRHFKVKTILGQDDYGSMREIIRRRFSGSLANTLKEPDLIVIDGGSGQVSAASSVLDDLKIKIPLIGLAKEFEEIHFPDERKPIKLDKRSEGLKILQRIRDEAHRFAITYHRQKRSKTMLQSSLERIEGVGTKRMDILIEYFGSIENIKKATILELENVKGIDKNLAKKIYDYYKNDINNLF